VVLDDGTMPGRFVICRNREAVEHDRTDHPAGAVEAHLGGKEDQQSMGVGGQAAQDDGRSSAASTASQTSTGLRLQHYLLVSPRPLRG
jgi:hypothetical protein